MKKKLVKSNKIIPYGKPNLLKRDIKEINKVLKSDFLTQGPYVEKFENDFKDYCKAKFSIAFNSATSALHSACLSLKVSKHDIVWTSAITFVASANCAVYCGAKVDFVDIDPKTNNMCVLSLKDKLIKAKKKNVLPKVVIPVHLSGLSSEMIEIKKLSKIYKFKIIEDASHAIGSIYNGQNVGKCRYSDITVFSLHPVKIITSAEGGLATTNNKTLSERMSLHRTHGITKNKIKMLFKEKIKPWYYEQIDIGYNYRMSDIHAALGRSQLRSLNQFILKRKIIANKYISNLKDLPLQLPSLSQVLNSSNHLFIIKFLGIGSDKLRLKVFNHFRKKNILVNLHYIPVYHHPFYKKMGFKAGYCPNAGRYYNTAMSIPIFPSISSKDQLKIINIIKNFF